MPKGTIDHSRRERIALAVLAVVARDGVDRLTHRAVAAEANVPLGSTTYHFSSREALLEAAVGQAKADWDAKLDEWEQALDQGVDLGRSLARLTVDLTDNNRDQVVVAQELYVVSLRSPAMRAISSEWGDALPARLCVYTDDVTARALAMCFDGLLVRSLMSSRPFSETEAALLFDRVCR